jgi:hypothetical protein
LQCDALKAIHIFYKYDNATVVFLKHECSIMFCLFVGWLIVFSVRVSERWSTLVSYFHEKIMRIYCVSTFF